MTPEDLAAIRQRDVTGTTTVWDARALLAEVDRLTAEVERVADEFFRKMDEEDDCGVAAERARIVAAIHAAPDVVTLSGPVAGAVWRPDLLHAIGEPNGLEDTFRSTTSSRNTGVVGTSATSAMTSTGRQGPPRSSGPSSSICARRATPWSASPMTDTLRALAEDGRDSEAPVMFSTDGTAHGNAYVRSFTTFGALAELHNACSPDVVLRLLDVVDAARNVMSAYDTPRETSVEVIALTTAVNRMSAALAALEAEPAVLRAIDQSAASDDQVSHEADR